MTAPIVESLSADTGALSTLVALLEQQRALFAQLRDLSAQQKELVTRGEADELLSVLTRRQTIINELVAANEKLEPYRRNWTQLYAQLAPAQQQQVGSLLQEVQDSLAEILQQDERDREALQSQQGRIGDELRGMTRAGSAAQAYRNKPATIDPRFTDRKG